MTTNHEYNTPQEGTTNWDQPLNDNFRQLDADVEIRDQAANRDQYQPDQGVKFLASDTGQVYLGDGSTWQELGVITRMDGGIYVGDTPPDNPSENDIWIDTSEI